eukprot:scaffold128226_cov24-Tisochrysis_lutea.AAC.1
MTKRRLSHADTVVRGARPLRTRASSPSISAPTWTRSFGQTSETAVVLTSCCWATDHTCPLAPYNAAADTENGKRVSSEANVENDAVSCNPASRSAG